MEIIRKHIQLSSHRSKVELVLTGDWHVGHLNVDYDYLNSVLKHIAQNKCLWIGMGDYMDEITVKDKRFDWKSIDLTCKSPDDQLQKTYELMKPIRHQCLGLLTGNHEDSLRREQGSIDFVNLLCGMLSDKKRIIPYGGYDSVFILNFEREDDTGHRDVQMYLHHGWTNSRTEGGMATRLSEMTQVFPMMDVYGMGHVHRLGEMPLLNPLQVSSSDMVVAHNIHRILTGGFLRGYVPKNVSYIEMKTYPPTGLGSALLKIQPFKGIHDFLDIRYERVPDDLP